MNLDDLGGFSVAELLQGHTQIAEELRNRGIVRSANNPVGDYAEYLFCQAFGWKQSLASVAGFDATDGEGTRFQIKARRITRRNGSRQMSALRNMDSKPFDVLAALLFTEEFGIHRAALIPFEVVQERSRYGRHANSHRFLLHDDVWAISGVTDVTEQLRDVTA